MCVKSERLSQPCPSPNELNLGGQYCPWPTHRRKRTSHTMASLSKETYEFFLWIFIITFMFDPFLVIPVRVVEKTTVTFCGLPLKLMLTTKIINGKERRKYVPTSSFMRKWTEWRVRGAQTYDPKPERDLSRPESRVRPATSRIRSEIHHSPSQKRDPPHSKSETTNPLPKSKTSGFAVFRKKNVGMSINTVISL